MPAASSAISSHFLASLRQICGPQNVLSSAEDLGRLSHDETEDLSFLPKVGVLPQTTQQVSEILKLANNQHIPVTPRGAGTGLSGGCLPVCGGIALDLSRMNRILEIDTDNLCAVVEPGVITEAFQNQVIARGLYYPPDPASRGSCTLGGNVAENAGGPRAVKYGVTSSYVLGIECVIPDEGKILTCGGKLLKNATGYNLTQLIIGSEGTLAVITKIILRLLPYPKHRKTLVAPFDSVRAAAAAVAQIFQRGITPSAVELMERSAIQTSAAWLGVSFPGMYDDALLLCECDGHDSQAVEREFLFLGESLLEFGAKDVVVAENAAKQEELWRVRRAAGEAVKKSSIYKEEDVVVPRARIPDALDCVQHVLREKYSLTCVCYGHAGDGNIHVNILKANTPDDVWADLSCPITEFFQAIVALGGTLTGEHGVGYVQRSYLPLALGPDEITLMRRLKAQFDPNGILNPQKVFPD